ncbi:MAG: hypothetical protein AAB846_01810 [Patescibacteria group bacterium]
MIIGRFILFLFLAGYALLAVAISWHLRLYAFSRSANLAIYVFCALAFLGAAGAVIFYAMVDWSAVAASLSPLPFFTAPLNI